MYIRNIREETTNLYSNKRNYTNTNRPINMNALYITQEMSELH